MKRREEDLRPLLDSWHYEDGKNIRRVCTPEGREVIQVRLPLGIEQYEVDGRPDGLRPKAKESWYHVIACEAEERPWEFELDESTFERLKEECMLYYHRYLLFFQLSEYKLCARDTSRNLGVLDFASKYADPKLAESLEQYRPYILRMNVMAQALDRIQEEGEIVSAMKLLKGGIDEIESLPEIGENSIFELERSRSLRSLEDLYRQLERHQPKDEVDEIEEALELAVLQENYEEAARLRDRLADRGVPDVEEN